MNNITHKREEGMGITSSDDLPDFQRLLDQFKGGLVFKRLIKQDAISYDELLYQIETNDGMYYVLEIDFIYSFDYVTDLINKEIPEYKYFVEVKQPHEKFEDTPPYKISSSYPTPPDFDEVKKYTNDK